MAFRNVKVPPSSGSISKMEAADRSEIWHLSNMVLQPTAMAYPGIRGGGQQI